MNCEGARDEHDPGGVRRAAGLTEAIGLEQHLAGLQRRAAMSVAALLAMDDDAGGAAADRA